MRIPTRCDQVLRRAKMDIVAPGLVPPLHLAADQPEGRIVGKVLGVIVVFVALRGSRI